MNLKQIEAFVRIANNRSFSQTAKEMYQTQPTVSTSINNLESELGVRLFNRSAKLVELTQFFGLSEEFIANECHRWYGEGGDHPHDARYDAAAAYLVMLVGERMPCPK